MRTVDKVRLLVFDSESRLLLMKFVDPRVADPGNPELSGRPMWATLGGALEPGEDVRTAAQRELQEETGLKGPAVVFGPAIWYGELTLVLDGTPTLFRETFVLVRTPVSKISNAGWSASEKRIIRQMKWWPVTELERTSEIILPTQLRTEARRISQGEYSSRPTMIDLSVGKTQKAG